MVPQLNPHPLPYRREFRRPVVQCPTRARCLRVNRIHRHKGLNRQPVDAEVFCRPPELHGSSDNLVASVPFHWLFVCYWDEHIT
jgi:hypothetical protein